MTTKPSSKNDSWRKDMFFATILYLLCECRQTLSLTADKAADLGLFENDLAEMLSLGLIDIKGEAWVATDKGRKALGQIVAMFDQLMKFEIFGGVRLTRELTEDECLNDNSYRVRDHLYDPRFLGPKEEDPNATDLRLAMISFLSERMAEALPGSVDLHTVVFLQKLSSGRFKQKDFWFEFKLGTFFNEVVEIVERAYTWRDISPNDQDQAASAMETLYAAGMTEQRKRDSSECGNCHIPLAIFEAIAVENGQKLTQCPNPECQADYNPPAPEGSLEACPSCSADIHTGDRRCNGCGAIIDRRYRAGTVQEETVAHTEVVSEVVYDPYWGTWGYGYGYYDYTPYGYYNAYNPFVDAVAFGCLCAVLVW